jgi:hypothetical protein
VNLPFLFIREASMAATSEDFVLEIPVGITNATALLEAYARNGHFPDHFGGNWDALLDCLRDFSWIATRRIVIAHRDLPLARDEQRLTTYLQILATAVTDWRKVRPVTDVSVRYVDHELAVAFPVTTEAAVRALGARTKMK